MCGAPAIVVARLRPRPEDYMGSGVGGLMAVRLGAQGYRFNELHLRSSDVPAGDILDIWHPGHHDYDRHAALSQS